MHVTNIADAYNDTLSINNICTNSESNIEIVLPLITVIPRGMSVICLMSLMAYTLIKHLLNKK